MVNNVGGNSHHIANISNQDNMELQQRGAGPASATANVADIGEARRAEIDRIAHQLESYFPGGEEIRDILHQKATVLHDEIGHTADDVIATMAKAEKLDRITSSLEGGANALGYAISGVPGDLIGKGLAQCLGLQAGTPMHDFVTGAAGGVTAVGFKAVFEKVLADSLKDTKWLQADGEKLEPFMQDVMKKRDNAWHKVGQAGMGGLGFDSRNVITGGLSAGTQTFKENDPRNPPEGILAGITKPGYAINQTTGALLTVAAGSMSGVVQNKYNKLHSPEFLLARTDWKERYQALADTSVSGQMFNGTKSRIITAGKDAATLQKWGGGIRNLFTINQLSEMVALGAGLGGTNIVKSSARDGVMNAAISNTPTSPQDLLTNPAFRALREGAAQAANLPTAALAYFGQGLAGVGSTPVQAAFANTLMKIYSNLRHSPADDASETSSSATDSDSDSNSPAIAGHDIPRPARGENSLASASRSRPASQAPSTPPEQDIPLSPSRENVIASASHPVSQPSSAITGQDIQRRASGDSSFASASRPASQAPSTPSEQDIPQSPSRENIIASASHPASQPSSVITGQDVPLPPNRENIIASASRPASQSSSVITGQDVPPPARGDSPINNTSRPATPTPPTGSQNEMLAQQMADLIGKMVPPPNKAV